MTRRRLLLLLSIVAVGWMTAFGQDDCRRRWAINAGGSPFAQPVQTGSYPRAIVVTHGTEWFVTGEIALPDKWAVEAGYFHTEIVYDNDAARTMQDFYLLSSVALTLRYDFVVGLDARTAINQPGGGIDMGSSYADRGMYHDFSVGLKVNFPFCFREGDAWTLFYMILDNILY